MSETQRWHFGEAWMICQDCGARLYSFDVPPSDKCQDRSRPCPNRQKCREEQQP